MNTVRYIDPSYHSPAQLIQYHNSTQTSQIQDDHSNKKITIIKKRTNKMNLTLLTTLLTTLATTNALTPNTANSTTGQKILDKALTAAGTPYAWGGGSCKGPTHDQPPYQYGDIGYDCSGLVCWAVCQVTGRDLFSEGLRVTSDMYCAEEKELKYKYVFFSFFSLFWLAWLGMSARRVDRANECLGNIRMSSGERAMLFSSVESVIVRIGRVFIMLG